MSGSATGLGTHLRSRRSGVADHGGGAHAQVALDRPVAVSLGEQVVDGGVGLPDTVGEPVTSGPGRGRYFPGLCLFFSGVILFGLCRGGVQAGPVGGDAALGGLAQVRPQVPPVGDLHRLGSSAVGGLGVESGPVAAHDLDLGVLAQPCGDRLRLPVWQQVDRAGVSTSTSTVS